MVFKKSEKPKSWKADEEEELEDDSEPEIEDDTEDMEDLDPESEDEKRKPGRRTDAERALVSGLHAQKSFQKTPAVYRQPEQVVMKGAKDWLIRTIPQTFECIDPANGEIILKAGNYEELMLKLQVMSTQHSVESAKNTR